MLQKKRCPGEGKLPGVGGPSGVCAPTPTCSNAGDVLEAHISTSEDRTIRRPRVT